MAGSSLVAGALLGSTWPSETSPELGPRAVASDTMLAKPSTASQAAQSPSTLPVALPAAAPPTSLTYPALGIDMPVTALTPTADEKATQSLVPPMTKDAYWLTGYGMPGAGSVDTTYLIGHSWLNEDAPFNHIGSDAKPGDAISIGTMTGTMAYTVTDVTTYTKNTLKDSPIWDVSPGTLLLVTCYLQDPDGKNVVVTAEPKTD